MQRLKHSDWQRMLEFLRSLYAPSSLDKFPIKILTALPKLVGAETFAIGSFNMGDAPFSPRFYTFPHYEVGMAAESFTSQRQNFLLIQLQKIICKHLMDKH